MTGRLQSADRLLAPAVAETVAALDLAEVDSAAVRLAHRLAAELDGLDPEQDGPGTVDKLSGRLLAVLESLGATPRARAVVQGGASSAPPAPVSPLAKMRAAR